jgi:peptide/nickel transport system permease protein
MSHVERESLALDSISQQADAITTPVRSPWAIVLRRLVRHRSAQMGLVLILIFVLVAVLAPIVAPYDARIDSNPRDRLSPPSAEHWFGTDTLGRDVLMRLAHGARVSLAVGFLSVLLATVSGISIGLIAGQAAGWLDNVLMRVMDILMAIPDLLLAIVIVAIRGPGLGNSLLAISIVSVPVYARLARSMALYLREQDFVLASRSLGVSELDVMLNHILPNSLSPIIVQFTLGIASAVLEMAALGFLGLGQQPPHPEWGAMLSDSARLISAGAWWALTFPGLAIMLSVLGFNLLGDGLRDVLDPRLKR